MFAYALKRWISFMQLGLYLKFGRMTAIIWQFRPFADEPLKEVLVPWNVRCRSSGFEISWPWSSHKSFSRYSKTYLGISDKSPGFRRISESRLKSGLIFSLACLGQYVFICQMEESLRCLKQEYSKWMRQKRENDKGPISRLFLDFLIYLK